MSKKIRDIFISLFVVLFILAFHYESVRYFYLEPLFDRDLPKIKFLFPPAGWIMFYNVDDRYAHTEIYGTTADGQIHLIDPHDIYQTRFVGFDNIHRNVLSSVLNPQLKEPFCGFLIKKFPEFKTFLVTLVEYPSVVKSKHKRLQGVAYQCP